MLFGGFKSSGSVFWLVWRNPDGGTYFSVTLFLRITLGVQSFLYLLQYLQTVDHDYWLQDLITVDSDLRLALLLTPDLGPALQLTVDSDSGQK